MNGRWPSVLAALVVLGVVLLPSAADGAASAADGAGSPAGEPVDVGIVVSPDGISWSTELRSPLFSNVGRVVPGDAITSTLWVRNTTSEPAMLRLSAIDASASSTVFGDSLSVAASGIASSGTPNSLTSSGTPNSITSIGSCLQLMPDGLLGAGDSRGFEIRVSFADIGGAAATTDTAQVDLRASLSSPDDEGLSATSCPVGITLPMIPPAKGGGSADEPAAEPRVESTTAGVLAFTGGSFYPSFMVAAFALGSGLILRALTGRRRRDDS